LETITLKFWKSWDYFYFFWKTNRW